MSDHSIYFHLSFVRFNTWIVGLTWFPLQQMVGGAVASKISVSGVTLNLYLSHWTAKTQDRSQMGPTYFSVWALAQ